MKILQRINYIAGYDIPKFRQQLKSQMYNCNILSTNNKIFIFPILQKESIIKKLQKFFSYLLLDEIQKKDTMDGMTINRDIFEQSLSLSKELQVVWGEKVN